MTATPTSPTTAGQRIEQARYTIPAGTRGPYLQRIDGRVALVDVPVDHADRVLLVERQRRITRQAARRRRRLRRALHPRRAAALMASRRSFDELAGIASRQKRASTQGPSRRSARPHHRRSDAREVSGGGLENLAAVRQSPILGLQPTELLAPVPVSEARRPTNTADDQPTGNLVLPGDKHSLARRGLSAA